MQSRLQKEKFGHAETPSFMEKSNWAGSLGAKPTQLYKPLPPNAFSFLIASVPSSLSQSTC